MLEALFAFRDLINRIQSQAAIQNLWLKCISYNIELLKAFWNSKQVTKVFQWIVMTGLPLSKRKLPVTKIVNPTNYQLASLTKWIFSTSVSSENIHPKTIFGWVFRTHIVFSSIWTWWLKAFSNFIFC